MLFIASDKILNEEEINSLKKDFETLFGGSREYENIMEVALVSIGRSKTADDKLGRKNYLICKRADFRREETIA